jgi:adenosine kinase
MKNFRAVNHEGFVIFDPGQMINHYDKELFTSCCKLANVLIINDTELLKVKIAFDLDERMINYDLDTTLIITKGGNGSVIMEKTGNIEVPSYKIDKPIKETTGAGDAYRGGLLAALSFGKSLEYACKAGSVMGALSVVNDGPQQHNTNWDEVKKIIENM